jgi:hypothetical protein
MLTDQWFPFFRCGQAQEDQDRGILIGFTRASSRAAPATGAALSFFLHPCAAGGFEWTLSHPAGRIALDRTKTAVGQS